MDSAPFFTPDLMVLSVWALPQLDFCILRVEKTARLLNQRSVTDLFVERNDPFLQRLDIIRHSRDRVLLFSDRRLRVRDRAFKPFSAAAELILSRAGNRGSTKVRFVDSLAERYPATIRQENVRYPVAIRPSNFVFFQTCPTTRCSKMHTGARFLSQTDSEGTVTQTIWLQTSSEKRMVWHSCGRVLGPPWAGPPILYH